VLSFCVCASQTSAVFSFRDRIPNQYHLIYFHATVIATEADLIIRGCTILPMNGREIIEGGVIAIKNSTILYVGQETGAPFIRAEKVMDGHGKVAIPGLINCHTHLAMTLFRGIAEDQELDRWLTETIWPLEAKLGPEDVYDGALLGCLEMIKSGTTCFADMYFHEETVAKAVEVAGLRATLAPGIIEAGNKRLGEDLLERGIEMARKYQGYARGRVSIRLGPHSAYTCSPELLKEVREKASALHVGMHIHLAESTEMASLVKKEHDLSEVELLESIGFLKPDVLAAHSIHLSEGEMQILARRGVKVSYNPVANMKMAQGVARVKDLLASGITVGIGTDGPASNNSLDMFDSMKVGRSSPKSHLCRSHNLASPKRFKDGDNRRGKGFGSARKRWFTRDWKKSRRHFSRVQEAPSDTCAQYLRKHRLLRSRKRCRHSHRGWNRTNGKPRS